MSFAVVHHSHCSAGCGRHQELGAGERYIRHVVGSVREPRGQKAHRGRHDRLGQRRRSEVIRTSNYYGGRIRTIRFRTSVRDPFTRVRQRENEITHALRFAGRRTVTWADIFPPSVCLRV